ncbi:hypothetical protein RND71_012867 [Anisodus tanguticus]|uniref:Uncharacterized protein n=1 Tax=Anisodus tanguticus TaxID=243964 RepID=A0AAE1SFG8_9SOLA|nr:hypothetical protein RND71_012867 [Anisodus tanguticus]
MGDMESSTSRFSTRKDVASFNCTLESEVSPDSQVEIIKKAKGAKDKKDVDLVDLVGKRCREKQLLNNLKSRTVSSKHKESLCLTWAFEVIPHLRHQVKSYSKEVSYPRILRWLVAESNTKLSVDLFKPPKDEGVNSSKRFLEPFTTIEIRKKRRAITRAFADISSRKFAQKNTHQPQPANVVPIVLKYVDIYKNVNAHKNKKVIAIVNSKKMPQQYSMYLFDPNDFKVMTIMHEWWLDNVSLGRILDVFVVADQASAAIDSSVVATTYTFVAIDHLSVVTYV